jgi:hypothetical protein
MLIKTELIQELMKEENILKSLHRYFYCGDFRYLVSLATEACLILSLTRINDNKIIVIFKNRKK